jgi:multidrug efflux pump subunit AcrA (membrane-fusion protein)
VPLGQRQAVVVPEKAIHYIGQLELVKVEKDGLWYDCLVKTGKKINGKIEVLSGLNGDEKIAVRD